MQYLSTPHACSQTQPLIAVAVDPGYTGSPFAGTMDVSTTKIKDRGQFLSSTETSYFAPNWNTLISGNQDYGAWSVCASGDYV